MSIVFTVRLANNAFICALVRVGLYHVVSEQHRRRCEVTAARPQPLRWAWVAQGEVVFRIHIIGWGHPLALFGADTSRTVFMVRLAHTVSTCSLARDGCIPCRQRSAQSPLWSDNGGATAAKVGSDRSLRRTLRMHMSIAFLYAWPIPRLYARCLVMVVSCRQRAAQSLLWSHHGGATAATACGRRSRDVALRMHINIVLLVI